MVALAVVAAMSLTATAHGAETLFLVSGNYLSSVPADAPASPYTSFVPITGLAGGETVVTADVRPADQKLYVLAVNTSPNPDTLHLYSLNPTTAVATSVGAATNSPAADSTFNYWMDFNPVADRIRVVSADNKSFRVNPNDGAVITPADTAPAFVSGDPSFGTTPQLRGVGYDNSVAGAASTTAYAIHTAGSYPAPISLVRLGGPGGSPSPNSGQLTTVGAGTTTANGFPSALDISPATGKAYFALSLLGLSTTTNIWRVDLGTGADTVAGGGFNGGLYDLAVAPTGTLALSAGSLSATEASAGPAVTVTRSGPGTGTLKVDYATSDGSATAGSDYTATSGTLTFADGETSKTVAIPVTEDTSDEGRESFTVELSNPVGNAAAGAALGRRLATVTIEDNDAPPPVTPPTPPTPDTTAPTLVLTGVPASLTRAKFLKGFTIKLTPSEPAAFAVTLEGKTSKATLASVRTTLFSKSLKLAAGTQSIKVKPNSKGVGKVRKTRKVTLRVVATDAAGNRRTTSKTIKVKPDPKKKRA